MDLSDRVALVCGAAGGSGSMVSKTLAEHGARLGILGRNRERLQHLASEMALPDEQLLTLAADLGDKESAQKAVDTVIERFGRLDILVQLVGGWTGGKTLDATPLDDFRMMVDQHLWTTLYILRAALPELKKNQWGRVFVVSSPAAANPPAKGGAYAIGKAAQEALIATLAEEVKGTGVTANILRVKTIDVDHTRRKEPSAANAFWTTPEEIAAAILYLCSQEAGAINGARLPLYGSP